MITAPSIEQFMLRKERHRKMVDSGQYPKSTPDQFIIPCYERSFGFRTNQYAKNSDKLEDFIDKTSFESFVRAANRIIDKELMQKAKNQNSNFFSMTSLYLKLSIALGILTFTILSLIVYLDFDSQKEQIILYLSIVLIIISVVIASICPIYLYLSKYTEYDYQSIIKEQLDKLAEEENQKNHMEGREYLKWVIEKSFFWIKLQINHGILKERSRRFVHNFGETTPPLMQ